MPRDAKSVLVHITELQRMIARERQADRPEWARLVRLRNLKRAYQLDIARALDEARDAIAGDGRARTRPVRVNAVVRSQPVRR